MYEVLAVYELRLGTSHVFLDRRTRGTNFWCQELAPTNEREADSRDSRHEIWRLVEEPHYSWSVRPLLRYSPGGWERRNPPPAIAIIYLHVRTVVGGGATADI